MKKLPLFLLAFFCIVLKGSSQVELKLYSGLFDRFGIAIEPAISNKVGLEIGSSYRSRYWGQRTYDLNNFFLNLKLKKYFAQKHPNHGLFYGPYLRYWLMKEHFESAISEAKEAVKNTQQKISVGGLFGYKKLIKQKFNISFSLGFGFSPSALYWYKTKHINGCYSTGKAINRPDNIFHNWALFSHIGHLSFAYIIGAKDKYKDKPKE